MKNWLQVTLLLCIFGTLREIRPSEPFVSEFLLGEWRNITNEQLNQEVYPVGTYSYLALLLVVFLITDFLRFKPIIILSGLSGIVLYGVLLWTKSLEWLQVSQFIYGLYMATEVAYLTYIYAKVDSDKYPKVSSYTRMAILIGRFLSGLSSQLLVLFHVMDYRQLNYITFTAQILSIFWAIWLPPVQYGIYFHRRHSLGNSLQMNTSPQEKELPPYNVKPASTSHFKEAAYLIVGHARGAYSRPAVVAWSILYACAMALFVQTQVYVQLLWIHVQAASDVPIAYNGFVEAIQTLLGAGGAFVASVYGNNLVPAFAAALQGVAVFVGTFVPNIYFAYSGYIVMGILYHYTITLASTKIASQLSDESCFGLIFGINTFLGTALQSLLTFIMINHLSLSIVSQYFVISGLFIILATLWFLIWAVQACKKKQTVLSS
ncbi:hypothetical protein JYU34_011187 [Plutella xylostella]|uniref:Uncharacterized protein n=1 Tax=Plutella xylostella TaxID=51655 RepID=A0ABQ7QHK6_PLUXY|nr:hypothetical protein JYU34_011187 [Plutella xylostella]